MSGGCISIRVKKFYFCNRLFGGTFESCLGKNDLTITLTNNNQIHLIIFNYT